MNRYRAGGPSKATPTTQCQKCLKRGHYSYECTAKQQDRPYASRPSRTQQLANPKLAPKITEAAPPKPDEKEAQWIWPLEAEVGRPSKFPQETLALSLVIQLGLRFNFDDFDKCITISVSFALSFATKEEAITLPKGATLEEGPACFSQTMEKLLSIPESGLWSTGPQERW